MYETHEFDQGSPEWHAHRDLCYNGSELPTAAGENKYKSRDKLIRQIATGEEDEISPQTQKLFDDGHRFEELARPLAEELIGEELYPSVLSMAVAGLFRRLGSSLDGKTMADNFNWEHKSLNTTLAASLDQEIIPHMYHWQMEQGMMINGAEKCLFTASKWDDNDNLIDIKHVWYESNPELRAKIVPTWKQVEEDVANYQPVEVIPAVVAAPTLDLPVVSIQTSGAITIISNLKKFGESLNAFIERLPTKPSTDQEFADCKAALAKLKLAEETLDSEEARALSQMEEIDEMRREKKLYQDLARTTRLALEKLVTAREAAIKLEIMQEGKDKLTGHIAMLNKRLGRVQMPTVAADFAAAIKNKRTVESLRNAVDTTLANAKIAANEIADKIQINLSTLDDHKEHAFLFNDIASLVMKSPDDLGNVIKLRITEHTAEQQRKLEAEREKIRKEEQERADREAAARVEAERKEQERIAAAAKPVVAEYQNTNHEAKDGTAAVAQSEPAAPVLTVGAVLHAVAPAEIAQAFAPTVLSRIDEALKAMNDDGHLLVLHYCERLLAKPEAAAA